MAFLTNRRSAFKDRKVTSAPSSSKGRCKTPEDIGAPPLDSEDDESDSQDVPEPGKSAHLLEADSSDELTSCSKNDIVSTNFSGAKPTRSRTLRERQGPGKARVFKRQHEDDDCASDGGPAKRRSISPSKDGDDEFLKRRKMDNRRSANQASYRRKNDPGLQTPMY